MQTPDLASKANSWALGLNITLVDSCLRPQVNELRNTTRLSNLELQKEKVQKSDWRIASSFSLFSFSLYKDTTLTITLR
jgi:hypothetical protein